LGTIGTIEGLKRETTSVRSGAEIVEAGIGGNHARTHAFNHRGERDRRRSRRRNGNPARIRAFSAGLCIRFKATVLEIPFSRLTMPVASVGKHSR
jgi:hypothetical protein